MTTTITPEQADTLPAEAGHAIDAAEDDNLPEVDSIIFGELMHLPLPGKELRMAAMQVRAALHRHGHLADRADDHYFAVDYTGCIHDAPDRETAIKWAEDFARTANGGAIGSERPEVAAAIGSLAGRAAVPSEQEPVAWVHNLTKIVRFDKPSIGLKDGDYTPLYAHPAPAAGVKVLRDALQAVVDEVRNVASASYIREPVLSQVIAALEAVAQ